MSEIPKSRPIRKEDLFDEPRNIQYNYSNLQNHTIEKNQKEFGNRKRIKP
jgi:hypothetical protein